MSERARELLRQAEQALETGDLRAAIDCADQAESLARATGDIDLADRAACNRAAFRIDLGEGHGEIAALKQLLLASSDPTNQWLAAFYISRAYEEDQDLEKAGSYAQRAVGLAANADRPVAIGASANLCGVISLRCAQYGEAEEAFQTALREYAGQDGYHRIMACQIRDNLGYVRMCTDQLLEGLELCEEARAGLDALDAEHYVYEVLQDLCYGYILDERLERAETCGERALELAHKYDDPLIVKNCLFLLGEAAIRRGDTFSARRRLRELTRFYPEFAVSDEIIDVFMATDLLQVVNLKG